MSKLEIAGVIFILILFLGVGIWFALGLLPSSSGDEKNSLRDKVEEFSAKLGDSEDSDKADPPVDEATEQGRIETRPGTNDLVTEQKALAEDVISDFGRLYQQAVGSSDEAVGQQAYDLLSERARTVVDQDSSKVRGLLRLTRNLESPNEIIVKTNRQQSENFAEVETTWVYPNEPITRYFYLVIENGQWRIDSLQKIQQ